MKSNGDSYLIRRQEYRKKLLIERSVPSSKRILDLGCGNGAYLQLLEEKCNSVVGLDLSKRLCSYAKTSNPDCDIVRGEISHLPFKKNSFDGVWASEILEHSSFKALEELRRVIESWFIATLPNPYSSNYKADFSHVLRYSFSLLRDYFKSWTEWKVWIKGMGIECPAYDVQIPRAIKFLTMAFAWHVPILAPTICIIGMKLS